MLEVRITGKAYTRGAGQRHHALGAVQFTLARGRVGALVGPSGCGKTTLLRLIAGLDPAFEGEIRPPASGPLALVFQEPRLLPWRNVEENIRIAAPDITEAELAALLEALSSEAKGSSSSSNSG